MTQEEFSAAFRGSPMKRVLHSVQNRLR